VDCSLEVGRLIWLGGVNSSIGTVCTALLTKVGASFVAMQGSVLSLGGPAGSCVAAGSVLSLGGLVHSCVAEGSSLATKGEGIGAAHGTGT
jgi:hypothetical protein